MRLHFCQRTDSRHITAYC